MCLEVNVDRDDLQLGEADLDVDLHVMHRQRVRVFLEVQVRRLLVAHSTADEDVRAFAEGADPVLAIVENFEIGIVGKDLVAFELGFGEQAHANGVSAISFPRRTSDGIELPRLSSICLPHRKQRCSG